MKIVGGQETKNSRCVRTVILASGSGSNFEAIVAANRAEKINIEIIAVIYNEENAGVVTRAEALGIKPIFISHQAFSTRLAFDLALSKILKANQIELVVLAGWMRLLSAEFLHLHPDVLNIHPSLLPAFPGLHAIKRAYEADVDETGCTVHRVTVEMDAGPIIAQAFVKTEGLNLKGLKERIQEAEHILYPRAISSFIDLVF